jgi:hypothetical protein
MVVLVTFATTEAQSQTSTLSGSFGGIVLNRTSGNFNSLLTIRNSGATPAQSPITVVISMGGAKATVSGSPDGSTYMAQIPGGSIAAGGSATVVVSFADPSRAAFTPTVSSISSADSPPANHFVYVVNGNDSTVSGYSAADDGALMPTAGSPYPTIANANRLVLSPDGKYAYVSTTVAPNPGGISTYSIDSSTGVLKPVDGSPFAVGTGFLSISFSPDRRFLYSCGFGAIAVYSIMPSGALVAVPGSPFFQGVFAGVHALHFVISPAGEVGVFQGLNNTLHAVVIDKSTGALKEAPGSPITVPLTGEAYFDSSGKHVLGMRKRLPDQNLDLSGTDIVEWSIDSAGALAALPGYPLPASAAGRTSWVVHANGKFLYFGEYAMSGLNVPDQMHTLDINPDTGALSEPSGGVLQPSSLSIQLDPTGTFGWLGSFSAGASSVAVDPSTGVLTPISGSSFAKLPTVLNSSLDPSGHLLFASAVLPNVASYVLDPTTHVPQAAPGSPFLTGQGPTAIASK